MYINMYISCYDKCQQYACICTYVRKSLQLSTDCLCVYDCSSIQTVSVSMTVALYRLSLCL